MMVLILCAIVRTVHSANSVRIVDWIRLSVSRSTDAVASSRIRTLVLRSRARARHTSCFWPTLQNAPANNTYKLRCHWAVMHSRTLSSMPRTRRWKPRPKSYRKSKVNIEDLGIRPRTLLSRLRPPFFFLEMPQGWGLGHMLECTSLPLTPGLRPIWSQAHQLLSDDQHPEHWQITHTNTQTRLWNQY